MTGRPNFSLLSVAANLERHKIGSGEPWLLLLSIRYPGNSDPGAPQQYLRLVRNIDPVTFDAGDGQGPQVYTPFNFQIGDLSLSSNGSVPETEIQASNVMRALQGVIEQYAGVVGADLTLYVLNAANPTGEAELSMAFTVKQTVCDAKQVKFSLGASSPLRRLFPIHMFRPNYCVWQYNSPFLQAAAAAQIAAGRLLPTPAGAQCGYQGSMPTCSHTQDGDTGCVAHNNLVRFGAFPGIGTNGAVVAAPQ